MGICPRQVPIALSPFCLLRVKTVPSEEDFASRGVLAGLIQSVIAISSVNYALSLDYRLNSLEKSDGVKGEFFCHRT